MDRLCSESLYDVESFILLHSILPTDEPNNINFGMVVATEYSLPVGVLFVNHCIPCYCKPNPAYL
jgi:hypothetical protein